MLAHLGGMLDDLEHYVSYFSRIFKKHFKNANKMGLKMAILELSWTILGPSCAILWASKKHLGAILGHLEDILKYAELFFQKIFTNICFLLCFGSLNIDLLQHMNGKRARIREAIACYLCHHACEYVFT